MRNEKKKTRFPGFTHIKSSGGIDEFRLDKNGLTVLLMERHAVPVATFMVTYRVGSRNEAVGYTGATHLLEHLMFKGTAKHNRHKHTSIWDSLENKGAVLNATTFFDRTNYFELLPREHLEEAIALEADRMRGAFIRESDRISEMTVVRNEFERGENAPAEALDKAVWAAAYTAHPYHHPTIGWRADIENVPIERLRHFYDTFYWPNNATVTVIGDFDRTETLGWIRREFGVHARSPHEIPKVYTEEPRQEGERHVRVERAGTAHMVGVAIKTPPGLHADTYALQVLGMILTDGKGSRLNEALVDKGLATGIGVFGEPLHDNGLFIVYATLTPGTTHERVENIIKGEYALVKRHGVTASEVARAKAILHMREAHARDGTYAVAGSLNEAIALGDWTFFTTLKEQVARVTPRDIHSAAQTYLNESQMTIGYFAALSAGSKKAKK